MTSSVLKWLVGIGCTQTLYPASLGRVPTTATWTPSADWNGSDVKGTFFARYGFYNIGIPFDGAGIPDSELHLYSAGDYVNKTMASPFPGQSPFLDVMRELTGDPTLILTFQDLKDLKVVKDPGRDDVVYNTIVAPKIAQAAQAATVQTAAAAIQTQATSQPVGGAAPVVAGQGVSSQTSADDSKMSSLTAQVSSLTSQLNSANSTLAQINKALKGIAIPAKGGGLPTQVLRKIANIMQSV